MCPPPPTDPIRPLGPVAGDIYVARTENANRVRRRSRRGDEDADEQDSRHDRGRDSAAEHQGSSWGPAADAGVYDDHGRSSATSPAPPHDDVPHIDTSA